VALAAYVETEQVLPRQLISVTPVLY